MKTAYDQKHVLGVRAYCLMLGNELGGKLVANYSDNANGSVITATLSIYRGPLVDCGGTAQAGGGGYDKLASCVSQIVGKNALAHSSGWDTKCDSDWETLFDAIGYKVYPII